MEEQSYWVVVPAKLYFKSKNHKNPEGLYALISSLAKKEGYCYASNQFLSERVGVSIPTISRFLQKLQPKYIRCIYDKTLKNNDKRRIYINGEWGVLSENDKTGHIKIGTEREDGSYQSKGENDNHNKKSASLY